MKMSVLIAYLLFYCFFLFVFLFVKNLLGEIGQDTFVHHYRPSIEHFRFCASVSFQQSWHFGIVIENVAPAENLTQIVSCSQR